jgi:hypothetical protein
VVTSSAEADTITALLWSIQMPILGLITPRDRGLHVPRAIRSTKEGPRFEPAPLQPMV